MDTILETYEGTTREEVETLLKQKYQQNYRIIYDRFYRKNWLKFWEKTYEAKVMIQKETSPEKTNEEGDKILIQSKTKKNVLNKDMSDEEKERKKEQLIRMLNEPEGLQKMVQDAEEQEEEVSKTINQLKLMVETLVQKMEEERNARKKPLPVELEKMESHLKEQEVDGRTARIYVEKAEEDLKGVEVLEDEIVEDKIIEMIKNRLNVKGPIDDAKEKVIALVGPTGVGKTTTLAKIGWELYKKGKTVGFITTDSFRAGAKKQLKEYGELMEAETIQATGVEELKEALHYFQEVNQVDHILIDTVGRNPMEEETIEHVRKYIEVANPTTTGLVMSSTSKVKDMKEILKRFKSAKIDGMVLTKLDETYNYGSILNVFNFTDLPLLFVTDGQEITKNIYVPSKENLAKKIIKKETELQGKLLIS